MRNRLDPLLLWSAVAMAPDDKGAGGGSDTSQGGAAADTVAAGGAADTTPAGGAADTVAAGKAADTVQAGAADDKAKAPPAKVRTILDDPEEEKKPGEEKKPDEQPKEYVDDPKLTKEENDAKRAEFEAAKPIDPSSYTIALPEGFEPPEGFELELDPEVDKDFRAYAASRRWSQDDVKAMTDLQIRLYAADAERKAKQSAAWGETLKADPDFGGANFEANGGVVRRVMKEFFDPETRAYLVKTGTGNHPGLMKGLLKLGMATGEKPTVRGGAAATEQMDAASILYPKG